MSSTLCARSLFDFGMASMSAGPLSAPDTRTVPLYLGLAIVPSLLIAFLAGSIVGLVIIAREGAQARKKAIPFGVFLALGGIIGLLTGPELIELYEDNFLN